MKKFFLLQINRLNNLIHRDATPKDVLINNLEKALRDEMFKVRQAQVGIRRIIKTAINESSGWNPQEDKLSVAVIVEAENLLRDLDGRK
jgi:hypothetical protein